MPEPRTHTPRGAPRAGVIAARGAAGFSPSQQPNAFWTASALLAGDIFAAGVAVGVSFTLALLFGVRLEPVVAWTVAAFIALAPAACATAHLYPGLGIEDRAEAQRLVVAAGSASAVVALLLLTSGAGSRVWLAASTFAIGAVALVLVRRAVQEAASGFPWWGVPAVLLGCGATAADLARRLTSDRRQKLRPVAAFDDEPESAGGSVEGVPVMGRVEDARAFAGRGVRHAIVADHRPSGGRLSQRPLALHGLNFASLLIPEGTALATRATGRELTFGGRRVTEVRLTWLEKRYRRAKRLLDLALGVPAAIVALPVVAVAALAVRIASGASPFYAQERIGLDGRRFEVVKLRTMYVDAERRLARYLDSHPEAREEWRSTFKLKDDPRILPVIGHALRASSIDELPQLWNILKGEMSLVGPRPFPDYHVEAFPEDFRVLRERVMPGLTGLWQITARSDSDLGVQEALDTRYIANWSIWMDLWILLQTPVAVVTGRGAR